MNVLLIAPSTDLYYSGDEVNAILNSGLDVKPLIGNINTKNVMDAINANKYDIVWFISHGTKEGVVLSDGLLDNGLLTAIVRNKVGLIVLNTCDSFTTAQMLQNETECDIIATIMDVPDKMAFVFGAQLSKALVRQHSYALAFREAKPGGNVLYIHLAGKRAVGINFEQEMYNSILELLYELKAMVIRNDKEIKIMHDRIDKHEEGHDNGIKAAHFYYMFSALIIIIILLGIQAL